jgi:SAM-dependent methyltransferase
MKPTERFSGRAEDYRRYRPGYPAGVVELIREAGGLKDGARVADIGSGTGIFARQLLEAGFEVTGVEPNGPMREAAEEELARFPKFHSAGGSAERTGLRDGEFDAITVAQAFHWFDLEATRLEFRRLLRPGGWVFIIWNRRDLDISPFAREYEELMRSLGERYEAVTHRERDGGLGRFFLEFRFAQFENPHTMDWTGLRGRFLSTSYAPSKGDPLHETYLARLEELFRRHAVEGYVTFHQKTAIYYGKLE